MKYCVIKTVRALERQTFLSVSFYFCCFGCFLTSSMFFAASLTYQLLLLQNLFAAASVAATTANTEPQ